MPSGLSIIPRCFSVSPLVLAWCALFLGLTPLLHALNSVPVGTQETYYLVDHQNPTGYSQVLAEYTAINGTPSKIYHYGLDLISQHGTAVYYFGYDGSGSTRFLLNSSGRIASTYDYDAYGNLLASTSPANTAYRFNGEQLDLNLNLYYLRARYYLPTLGRFWSMDSYEGSPTAPHSLHKYLYCTADPVNNIDPSGQMSIPSLLGGISGRFTMATARFAALSAGKKIAIGVTTAIVGAAVYQFNYAPGVGSLEFTDGTSKRTKDADQFFTWMRQARPQSIRKIVITGHGTGGGIGLGTGWFETDGDGRFTDNHSDDITALFQNVLSANAEIDLQGCHTGKRYNKFNTEGREVSFAEMVSQILPTTRVIGYRGFVLGANAWWRGTGAFGNPRVFIGGKETGGGPGAAEVEP